MLLITARQFVDFVPLHNTDPNVNIVSRKKWDMILFWGGQIAPVLKHTKAKDLMESILNETNAYYNDLKA